MKKGTSASPATAFERRVLPVPGGPTKRTPLGILAPISLYLSGFFKKSTISVNSSWLHQHRQHRQKLFLIHHQVHKPSFTFSKT